jgi:hypothetical protein
MSVDDLQKIIMVLEIIDVVKILQFDVLLELHVVGIILVLIVFMEGTVKEMIMDVLDFDLKMNVNHDDFDDKHMIVNELE